MNNLLEIFAGYCGDMLDACRGVSFYDNDNLVTDWTATDKRARSDL